MFYKLLDGKNIIGVIPQTAFMKYQKKHNIMISVPIESAQYAELNGKFYHCSWLKPAEEGTDYTEVSIIEINEDEYNALHQAFETEETVVVEEEPEFIEEAHEETDNALELVKEAKLREISKACQDAIFAGIDVELEDGKLHHFSLDIESQIDLITLSSMESGAIYHADGEACREFSAIEINNIVDKATEHRIFNTTYHNSLKAYVMSLDNINDIAEVRYGMEVPLSFQTEVLKQMYNKEGNGE